MSRDVERFSDAVAYHGEGPVWIGGLSFVDILAGDIVERGFALLDASGRVETLPEIWADAGVRMKDGGTDPDGRFYCGSMAYGLTLGAGALYRLDPGGGVSVVLDAVTISNGLAWSPDGRTAY
jgi:sugar lactone lactonase YvrE